jgi:predicted RNA binding protein YcfA (HicA-like mRNA interferase family)
MRVAERSGWLLKRITGDHYIYKKPGDLANLPIPDHRELAPGTLRAIIATLGMTVEEFLAALRD